MHGRRLLCIYQHAPTPGTGGFYRHRRYFSELVRRGWQIDLVSTPVNYMTGVMPEAYRGRPYVREVIDGIAHHWVYAPERIHSSPSRRAVNYAAFAAAAALRGLTLPRPDVIWASSPPLPVAALGEVLALRYRRPWILEVRDLWPEAALAVGWLKEGSLLHRALDSVARRAASRADAVIVASPGQVEPVRGHGARRVHVLTAAVVDSPPDPGVRARVRRELAVADDECLFVYVGALGVANGLDVLLDAVRRLQGERARFVIAGDGSDRSNLERRIAREGLSQVRLLGVVPKDEVAGLLAAADVCLHFMRPTPLFETILPNKILDYFAAHRPFVTNVPGVSGTLAVEGGGALAPSAGDLERELRRWIAMTPEEREARGEAGFAYASQRFDLARTADQLERLLLDLAER